MELTSDQQDLIHEGDKDERCALCGELWDSEYHMSDKCVEGTND